jgi:hypothetical protein
MAPCEISLNRNVVDFYFIHLKINMMWGQHTILLLSVKSQGSMSNVKGQGQMSRSNVKGQGQMSRVKCQGSRSNVKVQRQMSTSNFKGQGQIFFCIINIKG